MTAPRTALRYDDEDAINQAASEEFGAWGQPFEVPQELINACADLS